MLLLKEGNGTVCSTVIVPGLLNTFSNQVKAPELLSVYCFLLLGLVALNSGRVPTLLWITVQFFWCTNIWNMGGNRKLSASSIAFHFLFLEGDLVVFKDVWSYWWSSALELPCCQSAVMVLLNTWTGTNGNESFLGSSSARGGLLPLSQAVVWQRWLVSFMREFLHAYFNSAVSFLFFFPFCYWEQRVEAWLQSFALPLILIVLIKIRQSE